eukprot:4037828-Prymnesium_polylepis.1
METMVVVSMPISIRRSSGLSLGCSPSAPIAGGAAEAGGRRPVDQHREERLSCPRRRRSGAASSYR